MVESRWGIAREYWSKMPRKAKIGAGTYVGLLIAAVSGLVSTIVLREEVSAAPAYPRERISNELFTVTQVGNFDNLVTLKNDPKSTGERELLWTEILGSLNGLGYRWRCRWDVRRVHDIPPSFLATCR